MQGRSALLHRLMMKVFLSTFVALILTLGWKETTKASAVSLRHSTYQPDATKETLLQLKGGNQSLSDSIVSNGKVGDETTLNISKSLTRSQINTPTDYGKPKVTQILSQANTKFTLPVLGSSNPTRHSHPDIPLWLREHGGNQDYSYSKDSSKITKTEDTIAAVFWDAAYGKQWTKPITRRYISSNRYERTTVLSDTPDYNYVDDGATLPLSGKRSNIPKDSKFDPGESSVNLKVNANDKEYSGDVKKDLEGNFSNDSNLDEFGSKLSKGEKEVTLVLKNDSYSDRKVGITEKSLSNSDTLDSSTIPTESDSLVTSKSEKIMNAISNETDNIDKMPLPQLSWFDYLICTNRNMTWIFINFLLGILLIIVSIFAPFRLTTLRACTRILPRTHFVSVHLLIFIAMALKALYMFHLAFGGKERLPLILILILTNSSIPCFISVYLILIIMTFLTADVQVYKPKFLTMNNMSIFIVMMILVSFISDVIVGSAHSKSVLILSRTMLIIIAITIIIFFCRKHSRVIQVISLLKREFQGELKLLVVPSKDSPQQKQVNIKYILRNRLHKWCRVMTLGTVALGLSCLFHYIHAIFLISSHVPVWVWWSIHVCGALTEAAAGILYCIAAALTQRYDEKSSFLAELFVPPVFSKNKKQVSAKERNGNVVYQRVSYSSGTESTQYTTCPNEGMQADGIVVSRTPKPPRRRTATVRRSATFSYAPHYPRTPGKPCQPPVPNLNSMRAGSTSQIPMYRPGSLSRVSEIYTPASVTHVPAYSPESVRSMLVHEDGFVRIRTQVDPRETQHRRSGSYSGINESHRHHLGSNPQIHNSNIQQWNGYGSRESFYHCLPRRRRSSRSSSFHYHNPPVPETDYPIALTHRPPLEQVNVMEPNNERSLDPNYHSFSRRRRRSRDSSLNVLNNTEDEVDDPNRRPSSRGLNVQPLNNLDRSDEDYQSLSRRKHSRDDNNDPIYSNSSHEGSFHKLPSYRNSPQYSKVPLVNVNERRATSPLTHYSETPSIKHKISNVSTSPTHSFNSNSPSCSSPTAYSPGPSRREARYPKPFSHRGSTSSLRSEDIPYLEHYQRTNPVRRNHSSAGYFPSRYLEPAEPLTDDGHRYGSLRIGRVKKRQPGYVLHTNTSKILNKYLDKYPRPTSEEGVEPNAGSEYGIPNRVRHGNEECRNTIAEGNNSECDNSQRAANTSKESDADWALELITSSSMLTDFYSLKRSKKKNEDIKEEETQS